MPGIDSTKTFIALNIVVLTVSDTRTEDNDTSGDALVQRATSAGHVVVTKTIIPDDQRAIEDHITAHAASNEVQVVLLTGGTGVTARDAPREHHGV